VDLSEIDLSADLDDLFENAPCGYLSLGADGRITRANATFCGWVGLTPGDVVGRKFRDLLTTAGSMFYETHFAPLLRMQGFFNEVALDLAVAGGRPLQLLASATERRDETGGLLLTRVILMQAQQRRRYERELVDAQQAERTAREQLASQNAELHAGLAAQEARRLFDEQTAGLREQFIAVLGHDLRNPLAAIDAGRRMLAKDTTDAASLRILHLMGESITRMGGLIDDLMDLARGRLGGGIGIQVEPGRRIEPTLVQVIEEIRASHPDRTIKTRFSLHQPIEADHARLAQMFSNLLANAVTHGAKEQPIVVEATLADGSFNLSIANGGAPISPAAMERLFQPFYRGEDRASAQGLGLGLYIASEIAKAHGGMLGVSSDDTETRFTFSMPLRHD
jgi:sigma-B regulation protein RsbU (phosphoserine phosphatase)